MQSWRQLGLGPRIVLASVAGGLMLTISFWMYLFFFLELPPSGWLVIAGSWAVAVGAAVSAGVARPMGVIISWVTIWVGLISTWLLHTLTTMLPLLFFEYSWPLAQVAGLCAAIALPIAITANWVNIQEAG
jgi:hypothetical protein